jgi:putative solute:sodium symporter small subunit
MDRKDDIYAVNLFRPKKGYMTEEVVIIFTALFGWGGMTFGFQFFVGLLNGSSRQGNLLSGFHIFNLPFHFWFTAQFLPLWFVFLCFMFNVYIDRLTERHSRRRDRTYE